MEAAVAPGTRSVGRSHKKWQPAQEMLRPLTGEGHVALAVAMGTKNQDQ